MAKPDPMESFFLDPMERLAVAVEHLNELLGSYVLKQQPHRRGASEPKALLSLSEAASLLGVSRTGTLANWIAEGLIKTVAIRGRHPRIPRAEIERVQRDGLGDPPRHHRSRRAPSADPAGDIKRIKLP